MSSLEWINIIILDHIIIFQNLTCYSNNLQIMELLKFGVEHI